MVDSSLFIAFIMIACFTIIGYILFMQNAELQKKVEKVSAGSGDGQTVVQPVVVVDYGYPYDYGSPLDGPFYGGNTVGSSGSSGSGSGSGSGKWSGKHKKKHH